MCKPFREYLSLAREYTREVFTFGGLGLFVWVYCDARQMIADNSSNAARTAEILRTIEGRLQHLEACHERESAWRAAQGGGAR